MSKKAATNSYDQKSAGGWAQFMGTGWSPSPLQGITAAPSNPYCAKRIEVLSNEFSGVRLVIPAGSLKVRSNDTDYRFRAHSAFSYLTGITSLDAVPDSVLVLEPKKNGHEAILFVHPRSPRDTEEFYRDRVHGEFWIGRRMTLDETSAKYGVKTKHIDSLKKFLADDRDALCIRGEDELVDKALSRHKKREAELEVFLSEMRLIKDAYEVNEMRLAVDATGRGFSDMIKTFDAAVATTRGERIIEGAFFGRARLEGNELGYDSIVAGGSHACVLHWVRNDGDVRNGDLILLDAGVELDSLYTADITRTLPVNGKFTKAQRDIYDLVWKSQQAGFAVCKPGTKFSDINRACHQVLAEGLAALGILPISAEESMKPDVGLHRRWTIHGVSHMLGLDVHDCGEARESQYREGVLKAGMILTVEPGLYFHPDDLLAPEHLRGMGVRIEDDVLITETGCEVLSKGIPSQADDVEAWMRSLA
jgi:Xaa-Pro aminopeptidase